jgi:2-oxo-3-(phosphooxy)propyl 3-oxoalkanoate synthase
MTGPVADSAKLEELAARLEYDSTVPRRLVHKAAISEVFLTDFLAVDDRRFLLASQLPRSHSFYADRAQGPEVYDLLEFMEVCRQSCFVVAHRHFQVPLTDRFILREAGGAFASAAPAPIGPLPANLVVDAAITGHWQKAGRTTGLSYSFDVRCEGSSQAAVTMSMQWFSPEEWQVFRENGRLRKGLPVEVSPWPLRPLPVAASRVGRTNSRNVVVGAVRTDARRYTLDAMVDLNHPTLFDHPLDHMPAMLQFELYRQAAISAVCEEYALASERATISACSARFLSFAELDEITSCSVSVGEQRRGPAAAIHAPAEVALCQAGEELSVASVVLTYRTGGR